MDGRFKMSSASVFLAVVDLYGVPGFEAVPVVLEDQIREEEGKEL
jgi:hypothetical protein